MSNYFKIWFLLLIFEKNLKSKTSSFHKQIAKKAYPGKLYSTILETEQVQLGNQTNQDWETAQNIAVENGKGLPNFPHTCVSFSQQLIFIFHRVSQ